MGGPEGPPKPPRSQAPRRSRGAARHLLGAVFALDDRARGEQRVDLGVGVAGLAQDLDRVLAEARRKTRRGLVDAPQPERARDGEAPARAPSVAPHEGAPGPPLR